MWCTQTDLLKMLVQLVLYIRVFGNACLQCIVDVLELRPHVIGTLPQAQLDVETKSFRHLTLSLGSLNVLLAEFHPRVWVRDTK